MLIFYLKGNSHCVDATTKPRQATVAAGGQRLLLTSNVRPGVWWCALDPFLTLPTQYSPVDFGLLKGSTTTHRARSAEASPYRRHTPARRPVGKTGRRQSPALVHYLYLLSRPSTTEQNKRTQSRVESWFARIEAKQVHQL